MGATVDEIAALLSVILSLVATGACLFIWMAVAGWSDNAGVGAAILFIAMSVLQSVFSLLWYRRVKTDDVDPNVSEREMEALSSKPELAVKT